MSMQPFELPAFSMPYAARLNPHLEAARAHSKAWAREMGMLDAGVWDERALDSHDYALLCAYTHPDASGPALDVVTDWYVWVFFFDDDFLAQFKQTGDVAGARRYLARLPAFMPVDLADAALSDDRVPSTPVERGLADLWSRTAPSMSEHWRRRFATSNRDLLDSSLDELANINRGQVPEPIEYITLRRKVGGAPWSANLVEYAAGAELPPRVAHMRPVEVLSDSFSDAVHLRNDLFSYQRETEREGEVNNSVLAFDRFLRSGLQRAANVVNKLLTSRMHTFDHVVDTELPELFEDSLLGPTERDRVLRYAEGLRAWQAGGHEWHLRSGRYMKPSPHALGPTGLGSAAARFGSRRDRVKRARAGTPPFRVPAFSSAGAARVNPNLAAARAHSEQWAHETGMLGSPGVPLGDTWDERSFKAADMAMRCALNYPDASRPQLELLADWVVWAFFLDDAFVEAFKRSLDLAGAKRFLARLPLLMPDPMLSRELPSSTAALTPGLASVVPANPVELGLADLWLRTAPGLSTPMRRELRAAVRGFADCNLWELRNLVQDWLPDPIDYFEMRRLSGGAGLAARLLQTALTSGVPHELFEKPALRRLADTFADVTWRNDIVSYRKEIEHEGEINNSLLVVQDMLDCDLQQAVDTVNELLDLRLRNFEHTAATDVPALVEELDLDASAREQLAAYIKALRDTMNGDAIWEQQSGRYKDLGPDSRVPGGPTGLGTSALRLTG